MRGEVKRISESERKGEHPEARRSMSSMCMPSPAIAHTAVRLDCKVGRADSNEKDLGARGACSLHSTLISMITRPPSHLRFTTSNGNQRGEPLQGEQTQTQTQRNRTTARGNTNRDGIVVFG